MIYRIPAAASNQDTATPGTATASITHRNIHSRQLTFE
jgi:hypothetical protein